MSTIVAPKPLQEFEMLKREAIEAASTTADAYIQNWTRFVIGWEEVQRGRVNEARVSARELMQVGRLLNDPRSTGLGLTGLAMIALLSNSYAEALENSEQSLAVAVTPFDRQATISKACALVLLHRTEEGAKLLEEERQRSVADGALVAVAVSDGIMGVCKILQGNIGEGIRLIEDTILRREKEGWRFAADWFRLSLGEVYLQIIARNEKPPFTTVLKNMPVLLKVTMTGASRIRALMKHVLENPHFDPEGHHIGRALMILGLLSQEKACARD